LQPVFRFVRVMLNIKQHGGVVIAHRAQSRARTLILFCGTSNSLSRVGCASALHLPAICALNGTPARACAAARLERGLVARLPSIRNMFSRSADIANENMDVRRSLWLSLSKRKLVPAHGYGIAHNAGR
jgi:hypothetical protein